MALTPASSLCGTSPNPWVDPSTLEYFIHIQYDSSAIQVDYDPNIHGIATLTAQHGPVTDSMGYRDFMAAVIEFVRSAIGISTHTRLRVWADARTITVPDSFYDLQKTLATDHGAVPVTVRLRNYVSNSLLAYSNPVANYSGPAFPPANVNDPFGLGTMGTNPKYDYDIVVSNYLDQSKTFNMFFTITGASDPSVPITSQLTQYGYTSNGSQVVWTANQFGVFPAPLVDKYGSHSYMMYNAADGASASIKTAQYSFLGGIVNSKYSNGSTIAYIRVASMDGPDAPFYELTVRPLTFANPQLPFKAQAIWIDAFAALLTKLNAYKPTKYIIDSRNNGGGFDQTARAIASLFGTTRPAATSSAAWSTNQSAPSIPITTANVTTVGGSISGDSGKVEADAVAAVYPLAAVRSSSNKNPISLVFMNSIQAASAGDEFPHYFIGSSGKPGPQNIGGNVTVNIVGDMDGRLFSGLKAYDAGPINTLNPAYVLKGSGAVSPLGMSVEAEFAFFDRLGTMANYQPWLQPALLLPGWYDQTIWQDLGKLSSPTVSYPFGISGTYPMPSDNLSASWRDTWLEYSLTF